VSQQTDFFFAKWDICVMLNSPRKGPWLRYPFAIVDDYSHYGTVLFHPPFRGALSEEVLTGPANFQMRPLAHQIYFSAFPIHFPNPPQHAVVRYFFSQQVRFFWLRLRPLSTFLPGSLVFLCLVQFQSKFHILVLKALNFMGSGPLFRI
jgi:hypothetical protein